jgi:DDE superfamily endonuclease
VKQLRAAFPDSALEVWAFDEHRLGLKPIVRKVWSKRGQRPIAVVHHRYEWLYLYGFVCPRSGQSEWLLLPRVNVAWFNCALQEFAKAVGAGASKQILLVVDGAGWHRSAKVEIPKGIHLEFLPPYSPELQPAEHLWPLSDEPLVNRKFETLEELEETLGVRCVTLSEMPEVIRQHTLFHWWQDD